MSMTEEVCETCSDQGGVCIKSSDRQCFRDTSFESQWAKYCAADRKGDVKREGRMRPDTSLVMQFIKRIRYEIGRFT